MDYIKNETLRDEVLARIAENEHDIKKAEEKLAENFMDAFSWGQAGSKYKSLYCIQRLNMLLGYIDEKPEKLSEWVPYNINHSIEKLMVDQHMVNGGSYWGRLCVLMNNECFVWWIGFMKVVNEHLIANKPIK